MFKGHLLLKGHGSELDRCHRKRFSYWNNVHDGKNRMTNPEQIPRIARKMGSRTDFYDTRTGRIDKNVIIRTGQKGYWFGADDLYYHTLTKKSAACTCPENLKNRNQ